LITTNTFIIYFITNWASTIFPNFTSNNILNNIIIFLIFICFIISNETNNNKENNYIIDNNIRCEVGGNNKCSICDEINNECISCNQGYELVNKRCIQYSFKAIYKSDVNNELVHLIYTLPVDIIEMTVDGIKTESNITYTFPLPGEHVVYKLLNLTNCTSLNNMFYGIDKMTSIIFTS
jgi:hypothetical protein